MDTPVDTDSLDVPGRTLMGPGPSEVHPDVLRACSTPMVGHLDPAFLDVMDAVQERLRRVFRTDNELTIPVSGTGSAAMETAVANLVEPGETVLVPTNGYFGDRLGAMAERAGAEVATVEAPWGEPLDPGAVERALERAEPSVFAFVHGETSTGVRQPAVGTLVDLAHEHDCLTIVDTVASLGGVDVPVDDWGADVVYAGSQKCLSAPPGASPITVGERALSKIADRESPVRSWYLDLTLLDRYWGSERTYHHTAPISNVYALHEALGRILDDGLDATLARHRALSEAMAAGVEALGLELAVDPDHRLRTLNAVAVPEGVDDGAVIGRLLDVHGIEVAGGLGAFAGEIFRIGCMGYSARVENVLRTVYALGESCRAAGADVDVGAGVAATADALRSSSVTEPP